jgi:hypothetical protein
VGEVGKFPRIFFLPENRFFGYYVEEGHVKIIGVIVREKNIYIY